MESIIKQLYYGKINPVSQIKPSDTEEYRSLAEEALAQQQYIIRKLPREDAGAFDEMERLLIRTSEIDVFEGFSHGLKLGFFLALEILGKEETSKL